jgi:pyridoxal phosphate enzyme (YggS family)
MTPQNSVIAANIARVRERMASAAERAGRPPESITLVAVSKTFPAEAIRAGFDAGLRHFGENRVQEWESKRPSIADLEATWHLIGHLQSNKARRAATLFDRVDSVDGVALAQKLASAAIAKGRRLQVLIEVHLGEEETKSGAAEADLPQVAQTVVALPNLELRGLMAIPPYFEEAERARPYFQKLRGLRDDLNHRLAFALPVLSMGMSHDFEIAIEEGATEIRVGSAIFGARQAKT